MSTRKPRTSANELTRPMLEAELRRNRGFGGGISKAIDHVMSEREELATALEELREWCYANVAYFPPDCGAVEMAAEHAALLEKVRPS